MGKADLSRKKGEQRMKRPTLLVGYDVPTFEGWNWGAILGYEASSLRTKPLAGVGGAER